jgi:hypothetical protein
MSEMTTERHQMFCGDSLIEFIDQNAPDLMERTKYLLKNSGFNCHGATAFLLGFIDEIKVLGPRYLKENIQERNLKFSRRPVGRFITIPRDGLHPDHSGICLNGTGRLLSHAILEWQKIMENRQRILVLHKAEELKISSLYGGYFGGASNLDFYEIPNTGAKEKK